MISFLKLDTAMDFLKNKKKKHILYAFFKLTVLFERSKTNIYEKLLSV